MITALKAYLAQYEVYIWAAVAFVLFCTGIYVVHRLEDIGVERQRAADAKLAQAQIIHKEEVEKRAQELTQAAGSQLHTALVAPDPKLAVAVRVCSPAPKAKPGVRADGGPVAGSALEQPVLPGPVAGDGASQGVDIAPATVGLFSRCQAEVTYWRAYYANCKAAGACK
jgi:hypothetical protein